MVPSRDRKRAVSPSGGDRDSAALQNRAGDRGKAPCTNNVCSVNVSHAYKSKGEYGQDLVLTFSKYYFNRYDTNKESQRKKTKQNKTESATKPGGHKLVSVPKM